MLKYRGGKLIRAGFLGVVLILLVIAVGLQPQQLWSLASSIRYQALFSEAGGLTAGNPVTVSGMKVGTVSGISLDNGDALVTLTVDSNISLGSDTTAHIRTGTLLGERVVTLESAGSRAMRPMEIIPISRTSSPYSLTEALSDLTTNVAGTDTGALNQSLDTLSSTLDRIAPQLGPTFDGLTRISTALNERDDTLRDLLKNGSDVTDILSKRSQQVNTLIFNGNELLQVLVARRQAIVELLANTSAVARELSGLVHDNEQELAPTLDKLNAVLAMLEKNRDNIGKALPGLSRYLVTLGEVVASGPYYSAYIPNLGQAEVLQPFFDYAFGFRRGTDIGQPPDNAGPRAEIPFPYNGIPQPGEQWGPP
jgi:phospholipid/cholesterol/gamma-HCH transport system substrate-binding protein